jgi:hypothetical protein
MQDKPIGVAHEGATTAAQDIKDRAGSYEKSSTSIPRR